MSRNVAVGVLFCVVGGIAGLAATPCAAQRVWVGGGGVRVRAPFVRVDVGPYGGVSVRAPFAAVDVPPRGYYYDGPGYPPAFVERRLVERYPTPAELAAMSAAALDETLRAISQRLNERLDRFNTGEGWQSYLRLREEAVDLSAQPNDRIAALATMLDRFQNVAADPQYSMISDLPEFQAMEAALNEALSRPETNAQENGAIEDLPLPAPKQPVDDVPGQETGAQQGPATGAQQRANRDEPFLKPRPPQ